jgi:hypothetical protein
MKANLLRLKIPKYILITSSVKLDKYEYKVKYNNRLSTIVTYGSYYFGSHIDHTSPNRVALLSCGSNFTFNLTLISLDVPNNIKVLFKLHKLKHLILEI